MILDPYVFHSFLLFFPPQKVKTSQLLVLSTGLINQANGSAYIETEKAKIICAV